MTGKKPDFKAMMEQGGNLKGFAWPDNCGDFDIRIARDGTWYYRGSPIGRKPLVKLFATVLQKDELGQYWLVTPVERGLVQVEDAPFIAVELKITAKDRDKQKLEFRTNLDHWVSLDQAHPLRIETNQETGEPAPYIMLWDGLEAKLNRPVFYQLVELALSQQPHDADSLTIKSAGMIFKIT